MNQTFLLHYDEIALKGKNRPIFEKKLLSNISLAADKSNVKLFKLKRLWGRIILQVDFSSNLKLKKILAQAFGLAWFAPALPAIPSLTSFKKAISRLAKNNSFATFAIRAKVADKSLPFSSKGLEIKLGQWVVDSYQKKVDLNNPDLTFWIEIISKKCSFIFSQKHQALGGLPPGVNGQALSLLSGGIDSPVASFKMMGRGLEVNFIHFHSYPQTKKASIEKAIKLAKILDQYQPNTKLFLLPFLPIQKELLAHCDNRYLVILYRRSMLRIAQIVARKQGAKALITGDALGQVASQTVENLALQNKVVNLPILRPLIGFQKKDIISLSRKIKTYSVSIEPHQDCCSLFVPKNPTTKADLEKIKQEEAKINLQKLIAQSLKQMEVKNLNESR